MEKKNSKKKEIIALVYAAVLTWGVPVFCLFFAKDIVGLWEHLVYLLTTTAFYLLLMSCFKRRTLLWVVSPMLLLNLFGLVSVVAFGILPTLMLFYTLLAATSLEIKELFLTYYPLVILLLAVWVGYFVLAYRYVQSELFFKRKTRIWVGSISGLWLVLSLAGACIYGFTGKMPAFRLVTKVSPFYEVFNLSRIGYMRHAVKESREHLSAYRFGAQSSAQDDEMVVMLFGETGRFRSWEVNGYQRATSPCLLARGEEIISFDSCYSVANLTTVSVPLILSRATALDVEHYTDEPSVVDAFHEAGYSTAWVTDQSPNNSFLRFISGRCDYVFYHEVSSSFFDMNLLQPISEAVASLPGKQMLTIHSKGSHFNYSARYPHEAAYFRPDLNDVSAENIVAYLKGDSVFPEVDSKQSSLQDMVRFLITNSYDNSIRYTDRFVDSVINLFEQTERPVVLIYMADHGENLMDDERHAILHGQGLGTVYEYHVPLFVWASEAYKQRYPERWTALRANRSKLISTMNIYHTLLDLGSVDMPTVQQEKSLASPLLEADSVVYKLDGDLRPQVISAYEP